MSSKEKIVMAWSGGKDSSYALFSLLNDPNYEVCYLLSTINGTYNRLSMHGVREELIQLQADSIGIPLIKVYVCESSNEEYERQMNAALLELKKEGIHTVAYGDIFLEDLKQYRIQTMQQIGFTCLFPLWQKDSAFLVRDFIHKGFKTYTCCINDGYLDESWVGKLIDNQFISELPQHIDPCGENGEFHSFCFEGPIFKTPIPVHPGENVYKPLILQTNNHPTPGNDMVTKGFWFCDLFIQ